MEELARRQGAAGITVNPAVGKNGQLKTAGGLPTNASHYQKLLVTLETKSNPKTPGTIILEGTLTGLS